MDYYCKFLPLSILHSLMNVRETFPETIVTSEPFDTSVEFFTRLQTWKLSSVTGADAGNGPNATFEADGTLSPVTASGVEPESLREVEERKERTNEARKKKGRVYKATQLLDQLLAGYDRRLRPDFLGESVRSLSS